MMENRSFDHMLGWVDGADWRQGTSKRICPFLPLALWGSKYVDIARPISAFFADAAAGTLPEVSFVEPRFLGEEVGLSNDDHPFADIRNGQAFMNQVYAAITTGPAWPNTVFVINYDEWGMCRLRQRPSRPRIRSSAMKTDCWGSARHAS
jgi:phospholipase C